MKVYDVSMTLSEKMVFFPGDPSLEIKQEKQSSGFTISLLKMGSHVGTHVDAPKHFKGKISVDKLPIDSLVGECRVIDLTHLKQKISRKDLEGLAIKENEIILFKTKNSFDESNEFNEKFVFLDGSAADYLAEKKVRTVGIDYLSIEEFHPVKPVTHSALLSANIVIVEGLRLKEVKAGKYFFCCLPLKLKGCDGAPARAVLVEF